MLTASILRFLDAFSEAVSKNCEKIGKVTLILPGCENTLAALLLMFACQCSDLVVYPRQAVSSDKMSAFGRRLSGSCRNVATLPQCQCTTNAGRIYIMLRCVQLGSSPAWGVPNPQKHSIVKNIV